MSGPIICSKFDDSGNYLATALVALDSHQIKVQSVSNSQAQSDSHSLNVSFTLDKSNKITNLSWISTTTNSEASDLNELLAICLTRGSILVYSPKMNQILYELNSDTQNNVPILDFHYSTITKSGWSCDVAGNIQEWDILLNQEKGKTSIKIGELVNGIAGGDGDQLINRISTISYQQQPHLLIGCNSIYLININSSKLIKTFPGHIQPINSIIPLQTNDSTCFLTSAKDDRFINLYQVDKLTPKSVFVASSSVRQLSIGDYDEKSILVAVNEEGNLEVFNNPLSSEPASSASSSPLSKQSKKKKRKQIGVSSRSSNGIVKLSRPTQEIKNPHDSNLSIIAISNSQNNKDSILYSWLEASNVPYFDSLKWINEETGEFLLNNKDIVLSKSKPDLKLVHHTSKYGHDVAAPKLYTEGHTIISDGTNIRDLNDDEEEEEGESLAEKLTRLNMDNSSANGSGSGSGKTSQKSRRKKLEEIRTGISLSIILTQSLQNNDLSLLETVLKNRDLITIQNTINRLDAHIILKFLDKLIEKLEVESVSTTSTGSAASSGSMSKFEVLINWIKWILIIHGPLIVSLSSNFKFKLTSLFMILNKKALMLPKLLELQGRLQLNNDNIELTNDYDIFSHSNLDEEDEEEATVPSDVEYIEELDDAKFIGVISEDEDSEDEIMDGVDDYEESEDDDDEEEEDEEEDVDDEDVDIPSADDLDTDDDDDVDNE